MSMQYSIILDTTEYVRKRRENEPAFHFQSQSKIHSYLLRPIFQIKLFRKELVNQ